MTTRLTNEEIATLRRRQVRNLLTTLFLSQGIPMILGGDELGRTQKGNNNAYCQDNEISWYDWENVDQDLLEFTQRLIEIRTDHPVFRRRRYFLGRPLRGEGVSDIGWFRPDGEAMTEQDWRGNARSLGIFLNGKAIPTPDEKGQQIVDEDFFVIISAHHEPVTFRLPSEQWGKKWIKIIDTAEPVPERRRHVLEALDQIEIPPRGMIVLEEEG